MNADELAPILGQKPPPVAGLHTGTIIAWDDTTGANRVVVNGSELVNLPVLASAGLTALIPGTTVLIQRWDTSFVILGRVVTQASGLASPQFPIVMYPMFRPNGTAGATGYWTVNAGVLASWEGRARISLPAIVFDGVWGVASGSGSITYEARAGGTAIGSWTTSAGAAPSRQGPFRVDDRIGQDWLKIEVVITASSGTGERGFQMLGAYFQQITT